VSAYPGALLSTHSPGIRNLEIKDRISVFAGSLRYSFGCLFLSLFGDLGWMALSEDPSKPLKTGCLRVNVPLIRAVAGACESKDRVFESRRAHSLESITCSHHARSYMPERPSMYPFGVPVPFFDFPGLIADVVAYRVLANLSRSLNTDFKRCNQTKEGFHHRS